MREQVLLDALAEAVPTFRTYMAAMDNRRHSVDAAFSELIQLDGEAFTAKIQAAAAEHVGAQPTQEHLANQTRKEHPVAITDRAAAVSFTQAVLSKTPAAFVDGSQVPVDNDLSIPFGMVTIHGSHARPGYAFSKHDDAMAVSPEEIDTWRNQGVWNADHVVNYHRWRMELQYLMDCMEAQPGTVAVFDGSLIHSFTTNMAPALRAAYDQLRNDALAVSERTQSPLVGFVANSRARDLVTLTRSLSQADAAGVTDSDLVSGHLTELGDRTSAWICDRDDGSIDTQSSPVAFHYALLGPGGPCRIEYPQWVLDSGNHTLVHDVLLAQALAYGGYPRSIDECHMQCSISPQTAAAVQSAFFRLSEEHGLPVQGSWKARSKRRGARV